MQTLQIKPHKTLVAHKNVSALLTRHSDTTLVTMYTNVKPASWLDYTQVAPGLWLRQNFVWLSVQECIAVIERFGIKAF